MQRIDRRKNTTTFACAALLLACSSDPVSGAASEGAPGSQARTAFSEEEGGFEGEDDGSDDEGATGLDDDEQDDAADEAFGGGDDGHGEPGGDTADGDDGEKPSPAAGENPDSTDGSTDGMGGGVAGAETPNGALEWKTQAEIKNKASGATALKTAYVDGVLHVRIEGAALSPRYHVFIDADGKYETGIQQGPWESTGIDLVVENGRLYQAAGTWVDLKTEKWLAPQPDTNGIEMTITKEQAGRSIEESFGIGFLERPSQPTEGVDFITALPLVNFARPKRTFAGSGIVIPAYLDPKYVDPTYLEHNPEDKGGWETLALQAIPVAHAGKDYWVAVNGPHNGPFGRKNDGEAVTQQVLDQLALVKPKWQAIHDNGGKVFGYVHTCVTLSEEQRGKGAFTCVGYRPLEQVTADVEQWLKDFPDIDGIWIDEFYPHKDPTVVPKVNDQYDYTNSWHAKLTAMIASARTSGPRLLTVGNAGGRLLSDRRDYAKLVDVLCTFESAVDGLEYKPAMNGEPAKPGIAPQLVEPKRGQLALVHNVKTTTEMTTVLQRLKDEGYSHLMVTDGVFDNDSLWKSAPKYLEQEVTGVLQR